MTLRRPVLPIVLAAVVAGTASLAFAQQAGEPVAVPLSDPARPATVRVQMLNGALVIRGENRKDVLVTQRAGNENDNDNRRGRGAGRGRGQGSNDPSLQGFTRLNQRGGYQITEANNVVSIETSINRGGDIEIRVPFRTNLKLEGTNGSGITVDNVEGDIEAEHTNGGIRLTNVSGSVVAETTNGPVTVVLTRIAGEKAMSFVSLNGNVDVTLPPTAKANLRMRTDNGDIYTDFEVQLGSAPPPAPSRTRGGQFKVEVNQAVTGTINGGGPEFHLQTFNGNVILRRAKQ